MANTKISDLPAASNVTGAVVPIVQGGATLKAAASLFGGGSSGSGLNTIGVCFDKTDFSSLADFTITGGTFTAGTALTISGGTGVQTSYMQYTKAGDAHAKTTLEKWLQRVYFTTPTIGAATFGIGLGIKSSNSQAGGNVAIDNVTRLSLDTGSPLGSFYFYAANNGTFAQNVLGSTVTLTSATQYIYELERNKATLTATLRDQFGSYITSQTFVFNLSVNPSFYLHNVGSFTLWNYGGTISVSRWTVRSGEYVSPDVLVVGDSNKHGLYSEHPNPPRYIDQAVRNYIQDPNRFYTPNFKHVILAGISAGVADTQQNQLLILKILGTAKIAVFLDLFSNDIAGGVSSGTYQANYISLVGAIKAANPNATVVHTYPVARGFDFITLLKTFFNTNFPNDAISDLYTATKGGGTAMNSIYNSGDFIHLNPAGQTQAAIVTLRDLRNVYNT